MCAITNEINRWHWLLKSETKSLSWNSKTELDQTIYSQLDDTTCMLLQYQIIAKVVTFLFRQQQLTTYNYHELAIAFHLVPKLLGLLQKPQTKVFCVQHKLEHQSQGIQQMQWTKESCILEIASYWALDPTVEDLLRLLTPMEYHSAPWFGF